MLFSSKRDQDALNNTCIPNTLNRTEKPATPFVFFKSPPFFASPFPPSFTDTQTSKNSLNQSQKKIYPSNLDSNTLKRLFPPQTRRSSYSSSSPSYVVLNRPSDSSGMALNVFKLCSGLRVVGYLMVLLVGAIVAVSYYAVVVITCASHFSVLSFFIIALFHVLLVLLIWSYFMVVYKDPGSVPESWKPMLDEERMETGHSISLPQCAPSETTLVHTEETRRLNARYCARCQNSKPPRCHHCSVCQRCVLKMDHHCVWVVNCVGARNYKFFLLFLLYTFLETTLDTLALLPHFIKFFGEAKNHSSSPGNLAVIVLAFVINLAFALSLLCFLVMHASLLSSNTTTIEVYEKKKTAKWKYDLGLGENFQQVFGKKKALWLFPMFAKEDLESIPALQGLDFPMRPDVET